MSKRTSADTRVYRSPLQTLRPNPAAVTATNTRTTRRRAPASPARIAPSTSVRESSGTTSEKPVETRLSTTTRASRHR